MERVWLGTSEPRFRPLLGTKPTLKTYAPNRRTYS
jgi:hypothetical protein